MPVWVHSKLAWESMLALAWNTSSGWDADNWRTEASCRDLDTDLFFPAGETGLAAIQIQQAKAICRTCPVSAACLEFAMVTHQEYGIYGGTTEDERRRLRRQWKARLRAQRAS
jgi:WhiB family transcriptional regulator, redox-sensing transcriptional regulator